MKPFEHFDITKNLPIVELFPVLWADEGADLDPENEQKFKDMILKPINIVNGTSIGLGVVFGAVLVFISCIMAIRGRKCKK